MNVLLIGAGRMGLRHIEGLMTEGIDLTVVDPQKNVENVKNILEAHAFKGNLNWYADLQEIPSRMVFDAAILSETAQQRLARFSWVANRGIPHILIEKPMEQSRQATRTMIDIAREQKLDVRCNHYRRALPFFRALKEEGGPFEIIIYGGAFGLCCNGIHWIDLMVYLSGCTQAALLFGEVDKVTIASGRGAEFRDYGGRAVFGFGDGSRLFLSSNPLSSNPMNFIITLPRKQFSYTYADNQEDNGIIYTRHSDSQKPNYQYGADYHKDEVSGFENLPFPYNTLMWLLAVQKRGAHHLPTIEQTQTGHELLFDLLETTGETIFPFT